MAVTESQLNIVLQEAFTCYLTFLYDTRKVQESNLPQAGRGANATTDISTHQYFNTRINTTELCLQYLGDISKHVRKLVDDSLESRRNQSIIKKPETSLFDRFRLRRQESYQGRGAGNSAHHLIASSAEPPRSSGESMAGRTHRRSSHSQVSYPILKFEQLLNITLTKSSPSRPNDQRP